MFELIPFGRRGSYISFDPFRQFEEMERRFFSAPVSSAKVSSFRTDIVDKGDSFLLSAELPGFAKEDIALEIENDMLTISAKRSYDKENEEKDGYLRRERFYGSFSRRFDVSAIEQDNIEAEYKDGILSLTLPKKQEVLPQRKAIEIR